MLKYLVQVVQVSLTAAVLTAAAFAFISRSSGVKRVKPLALGGAAGAVFALVLAVLKRVTVLIDRESWNTGILAVSIVYGAAFAVLSPKRRRGEASPRAGGVLSEIAGAVFCCSLLFFTLTDIFLYPTQFTLAGESVFSTDFLFKLIGYLAGLALVCFAGLSLYKAGSKLPARARAAVFFAGLGVNAVDQILKIVQSLYSRRIIPQSRFLFNILKRAVNYNGYFLYAVMAVTLILPIALWAKSFREKQAYSNPAEHRKLKAAARNKRRWSASVVTAYALSLLCLTAVRAYDEREVVLSPIEPMTIVGETITIPSETVSDGRLHRFMYTASDGTGVRFIVIKKNEAAYGVGLDACDICGPTGYYERRDEVVCKLCDVVMNKSTIGFKGGCNPVPLAYTLENGSMVIRTSDLESEKGRFK
ncbi:MAG: Fe-S-containing protein [Oscillospiraceae bacterium]|jgi:uncharacterized membrane protein|nr:Fe-S-containing protein [Oscillospiraceae bacterium]